MGRQLEDCLSNISNIVCKTDFNKFEKVDKVIEAIARMFYEINFIQSSTDSWNDKCGLTKKVVSLLPLINYSLCAIGKRK